MRRVCKNWMHARALCYRVRAATPELLVFLQEVADAHVGEVRFRVLQWRRERLAPSRLAVAVQQDPTVGAGCEFGMVPCRRTARSVAGTADPRLPG